MVGMKLAPQFLSQDISVVHAILVTFQPSKCWHNKLSDGIVSLWWYDIYVTIMFTFCVSAKCAHNVCCDGCSEWWNASRSQEVLQKGSCAQETIEWTWSRGESLLLLARCIGVWVLRVFFPLSIRISHEVPQLKSNAEFDFRDSWESTVSLRFRIFWHLSSKLPFWGNTLYLR